MTEDTPRGLPSLHIHQPAMISAATLRTEGMTTLVVRQSPVVHEGDWYHAPVQEFLRAWCHSLLAIFKRPDPGMMFGTAVKAVYRIHEECPGTEEHECSQHKKGMAA